MGGFSNIGDMAFLPGLRKASLAVLCTAGAAAFAQTVPPSQLPSVTVTARANEDPVEKSYRKMIRAMDYFERHRALAPGAPLRFKLLPRKRETDMGGIAVEVVGNTVDFSVPVAPDHTFTLQRNKKAFDENALVIPNRRKQTMTWRTDIRTPGLPAGTRRLGDLRLECRVGMEAGLISNHSGFLGGLVSAFLDTPDYCDKAEQRYLFFADRPLFGVALVAGARREILPVSQLYAGASEDPRLAEALPYCDCEVLVDRAYFLPLADRSWPDDTRVEFEYIGGAP